MITPHGPKIIDIDYANAKALSALTSTMSLGHRMQVDVDHLGRIVGRIFSRSAVTLEFYHQCEPRLREAQSLDSLRAVMDLFCSGPVALPIQSLLERMHQAIELNHPITLRKLVINEVDQVAQTLASDEFSPENSFGLEEARRRMARYEDTMRTLVPLLAHGCYWSATSKLDLWAEASDRIANASEAERRGSRTVGWVQLRDYPVLIAVYAAGIGALAGHQYSFLSAFDQVAFRDLGEKERRLANYLWLQKARSRDLWNEISGRNYYTPTSDMLSKYLYPLLQDLLPSQSKFDKTFDRFEYLSGLMEFQKSSGDPWGPVGQFIWSKRHPRIWDVIKEEALSSDWPPFKEGLFDRGTFDDLAVRYNQFLGRVANELRVF